MTTTTPDPLAGPWHVYDHGDVFVLDALDTIRRVTLAHAHLMPETPQ